MVQPLWKTVWRFLKKLKIELPCNLAVLLLGIYPEKTIIQKDTSTPMFIAALFTIAKTWEQLKCPATDEWIKRWYIYPYTCLHIHIHTVEYYSAIKNEIMPFAGTWIDLEIIILSEISQKKTNMILLICGI